jgi:hypothetical protein
MDVMKRESKMEQALKPLCFDISINTTPMKNCTITVLAM